jgi:hypothetical protein
LKLARYAVASVIFLLAFSIPWVSSTTRASTSPEKPIPATFFGVSVLGITGQITAWPLSVPVGTLGKTEGTEWNDLEPSNGTYVWTRLDNAISEARSAGITNFIYTLWSTPEWASSEPHQSCILTATENVTGCAAPPTNIRDWDSFVTALVTRYKGEIQYFELWNEANLAETYSGNVSEIVTMAQHAYDDIKSIDPSAIVLTPSSSSLGILPYTPGCNPAECWLAQYLQAGGSKYADGVAFHAYAYLATDAAGVQVGIACPTGEIEECAGSPLATEIAGVRSIIANYSLADKPLIATEGGLPSDIISQNLTGTADQQTAYVSRWFIVQASENVSIAVWFSEFPAQSGLAGFGTAAAEEEINQGYNQTYHWLVGSTFSGPCSLSSGVSTCSITTSAGHPELIVWADSNSSSVPYAPPGQFTEYQDLSGATYQVSPGSSITLGEKPILLEAASASSTTITTSNTTVTTTGSSTGSPTESSSSSTANTTTATSSLPTTSSETTSASSLGIGGFLFYGVACIIAIGTIAVTTVVNRRSRRS